MAATRLSPLLAAAPWPRPALARPCRHKSARRSRAGAEEAVPGWGASRRRVVWQRARAPSSFRAACGRRSTVSTASIRRRRRLLPVLAGSLDLKAEAVAPRPRRLTRSESGALRYEVGPRSGDGGPRSGDPARREAEQRQAGDDGGADPPFPPVARTPLPRPGPGDAPFFPRRRRRGRTAGSELWHAAPPCSFPGRHLLPRLLLVLLSVCDQLPQAMREGKHETAADRARLHDRNVCILGSFADALREAPRDSLSNRIGRDGHRQQNEK
jgi:hypothetical protein